jgi:hypothetical protein
VAQVVECLLCKHKALNSNPNLAKQKISSYLIRLLHRDQEKENLSKTMQENSSTSLVKKNDANDAKLLEKNSLTECFNV